MPTINKLLKGFIYFFAFNFTSLNAQISELQPNINSDAKELYHKLNSSQDSLILKSEYPIFRVEFTNTNFTKKFETYKKEVTLPIYDLPLGRYATAVFVNRKIIMLTLLRYKDYPTKNKVELTDSISKFSKPTTIKRVKVTDSVKRIVEAYWVIEEVNARFGSWKRESLLRHKTVLHKIKKNKYDIKSITGKYNRLTVYEVYNVRQFTRYNKSSGFNPTPYYKTSN